MHRFAKLWCGQAYLHRFACCGVDSNVWTDMLCDTDMHVSTVLSSIWLLDILVSGCMVSCLADVAAVRVHGPSYMAVQCLVLKPTWLQRFVVAGLSVGALYSEVFLFYSFVLIGLVRSKVWLHGFIVHWFVGLLVGWLVGELVGWLLC